MLKITILGAGSNTLVRDKGKRSCNKTWAKFF